ncbi:hypothetical protein B0H19DRAFT_1248312 [Mycena capillaripes]|nr:hypothetical protein B0H19DRAFT_1248312 [Mycena capillaripes]
MASSSAAHPITLHFQNVVRVAGETIVGSVDLNVALAQEHRIEHLRIKLRGSITTRITTQSRQLTGVTHRETVPLLHSNQVLWTRGSAFPEAGSHVISCPFQFQLPENLPPSFYCDAYSSGGAISYSLEVVGDRPGIFRLNRRIRRVFSVVTAASQAQLITKESLRQDWIGGLWRYFKQEKQLRQGVWGEYSRAYATVCYLIAAENRINFVVQLSMPDLPSFPIATPIPYSLHVVTETKTLDRSDRPEDRDGQPLFPAPPSQSTMLKQELRRSATVCVRNRMREVNDTFDLQGVRSLTDAEPVAHPRVQVLIDEPVWIPKDEKDEKGGRGFWRRAVHFNSTLVFPFAPTFNTETLDWMVIAPLLAVVTINILLPTRGPDPSRSQLGMSPSPIGAAGTSSITHADVLAAGPPPMFDLPPSYWAGEDHDWDEKN